MKRRLLSQALITTLFALGGIASAQAQTKWDLPAAYPANNFHTENLVQFANDVEKASGGKLKITVHANASLFKAPEMPSKVVKHKLVKSYWLTFKMNGNFLVPMACPSWQTATTNPSNCTKYSAPS